MRSKTRLTAFVSFLAATMAAALVWAVPQDDEIPPTPTERAVIANRVAAAELAGESAKLEDDLTDLLVTYSQEVRAAIAAAGGATTLEPSSVLPWPTETAFWNQWGGHEAKSGEVVTDKAFVDGSWCGIHHDQGHGPLDNFTLSKVTLHHHRKWASRMYRVRAGNLIVDCLVSSVLNEHGFYFNGAGYNGEIDLSIPSVVWRRVQFRDIGSQAIQWVGAASRPSETPFPMEDATPGGPLIVEDCELHNVGWNHGGNARASYAISFFGSPNDVEIRGTTIDNRRQEKCKGAIYIGPRESVLLEDLVVEMGDTDRPVLKFEWVRDQDPKTLDVVFRNCTINATGGQAWIDFTGCPDVLFDRCDGNVRVKRDGVDVGAIGQVTGW